jgi:hypothetical protein
MRLVLIADRNILARGKNVRPKAKSGLVVIGPVSVVVEHPAGVFLTAWFMDDLPDLILFPLPEAADAAMIAVLPPFCCVDMPLGIERRYELIPVMG